MTVGLRDEQGRPAVLQHILGGELDPIAREPAGLGSWRDVGIQPEQRGEPGRMSGRPTDAMTPALRFFIPNRLQQSRAADVQFVLKRSRPVVPPWQSAVVR